MPPRTYRTVGSLVTCSLAVIAWCCATIGGAAQPPTSIAPSRVLVVYNANAGDEDGDGVQDSLQVANYYAAKRGVPAANILSVNCTNDGGSNQYYYYTGEYPKFYS